ncbi:elicitor-responsive protein 3-like isoform X2 [Typha angustifolia]|uniref:elicitor-responsive protein 3-like isoform X2 n=1 Tax=Typha angustifolia TaxID=59011 RepID=UPI003C2F040E
MVEGTLEVLLVSAKGLDDADFLGKMDPYAILICRTQEQKSNVKSGAGSDPEWNESFKFTLSNDVEELTIKLMDSDAVSADDFVGEAKKIMWESAMKNATMAAGMNHHERIIYFQYSRIFMFVSN